MSGVRIPDGLMLTYPALCLSLKNFSPSFVLTLEDILIPHTFLKMCLDSYLNGENLDPDTNPLISPLKASRNVLERMPSIRIIVGNKDPL